MKINNVWNHHPVNVQFCRLCPCLSFSFSSCEVLETGIPHFGTENWFVTSISIATTMHNILLMAEILQHLKSVRLYSLCKTFIYNSMNKNQDKTAHINTNFEVVCKGIQPATVTHPTTSYWDPPVPHEGNREAVCEEDAKPSDIWPPSFQYQGFHDLNSCINQSEMVAGKNLRSKHSPRLVYNSLHLHETIEPRSQRIDVELM